MIYNLLNKFPKYIFQKEKYFFVCGYIRLESKNVGRKLLFIHLAKEYISITNVVKIATLLAIK